MPSSHVRRAARASLEAHAAQKRFRLPRTMTAMLFGLTAAAAASAASQQPAQAAPLQDQSVAVQELDFQALQLAPEQLAAVPVKWGRFGPAEAERLAGLFHAALRGRTIWVSGGHLTAKGQRLMDALAEARWHGLNAADYDVGTLRAAFMSPESSDQLDRLMSYAFLMYGADMLYGQTRGLNSTGGDFGEAETPMGLLIAVDEAETLDGVLDRLAPRHPQYPRLVKALETLERERIGVTPGDIATAGGIVHPGEDDVRVPAIRQRLRELGHWKQPLEYDDHEMFAAAEDLPPVDAERFDAPLAAALEAFQESYGLAVDGVIGPNTVGALNEPYAERIDAVVATLERWRRLPNALGETYALLNVPHYNMQLVDGGRVAVSMDTAVGTVRNQTPLFSDTLEYMVFNPNWTVPESIARKELFPKLWNQPGYLEARNFRVLDRYSGTPVPIQSLYSQDPSYLADIYTLQQQPGPRNALGRIKFMFPNRHSVYMHDTNAPKVFARHDRAVSHGCVRLAEPHRLSEYLLTHFTDRREDTETLLAGDRKIVSLNRKIPVHVVYLTAWVQSEDAEGLRVRPDIYGKNAELLRQLDSRPQPAGEQLAEAN